MMHISIEKKCGVLLLVCFCVNICYLSYKITNPLRELEHGFRQCQTAVSAYWLKKEGIRLDYQTPIMGSDWRIPIEFPSYQIVVALFSSVSSLSIDLCGRIISIAFFYGSLAVMYGIINFLFSYKALSYCILSFTLINPIYLFWPRAFLYETTALFFSVLYLYFFLVSIKNKNLVIYIACIIAGALSSMTKITTFCIFILPAFVYVFIDKKEKIKWLYFFISICIPVAMSLLWNSYTDTFKNQHLIANVLNAKNHLDAWILWEFSERINIETWKKIFTDSLFIVKLFPFFILLYKLKYWLPAMFCLLFWILGPALFTRLYYVHGYYNIANSLFLSAFVGFIFYSILIKGDILSRWVCFFLFAFIAYTYHHKHSFYFKQSLETDYTDIFYTSNLVKRYVKEGESFMVMHHDWYADLPYYAERKCIMIPGWFKLNEHSISKLEEKVITDKVIGIALRGDLPSKDSDTYKAITSLGFDPEHPIAISEDQYWWHWYVKKNLFSVGLK